MFTVWSMDDCNWCTRVCELLADKGIPFEKVQPPLPEMKAMMRIYGFTTLPQVFNEDGSHIGGYAETVAHLK